MSSSSAGRQTATGWRRCCVQPWGRALATRPQDVTPFLAHRDHDDLLVLRDLAGAGKIAPVIDRRFSLAEVPDAIRYLESGQVSGKVVTRWRPARGSAAPDSGSSRLARRPGRGPPTQHDPAAMGDRQALRRVQAEPDPGSPRERASSVRP